MKTYSNQFPIARPVVRQWALYYDEKQILHGTYALCTWKKNDMLKTQGGLVKTKFNIKAIL